MKWRLTAATIGLSASLWLSAAQANSSEECEMWKNCDFEEGTNHTFYLKVSAYWKEYSERLRMESMARIKLAVEKREAEELSRQCWDTFRSERRKVNWNYSSWRWYGLNCPKGR